ARLIGPLGMTTLGVSQWVIEVLCGRQQIRVREHTIAGFGPALRLEVGEQRSRIAKATRIELETDESGEGLLRRSHGCPATAQSLADLIAAGQMLAGLVDYDVDPAGADDEEVLQGRQRLLLVLCRRRIDQSPADFVAEVGDVRAIDVRCHVLDLRGVEL